MGHRLLFFREPSQIACFSDYIDEIADCGVTHVSLAATMGDVDLMTTSGVKAGREILERRGVCACGIHAPFGGKRDLNVVGAHKIHSELIPRAAELGVRTCVLHAGLCNHHIPVTSQWSDVRRNLDHLVRVAEESNVILALENLPPAYLGSHPEDLVAFVMAYDSPHVRLCFDSGHANMNGSASRILQHMAPQVVTMHLHDNDGAQDSHLFPGRGTIDWRKLVEVINEECRPAHIEIEAFNRERLTALEILALYNETLA